MNPHPTPPDPAPQAVARIDGREIPFAGVSQTTLLTLYNRASEALRPHGLLKDPEAARIFKAIEYDFPGVFGKPDASAGARAAMFDRLLRRWLARHPGGQVVELGCGLETQFHRVDDGQVNWLSIDLPEVIRAREALLTPNPRLRHLGHSVLDLAWMDQVDASRGVFITAQGLFVYFDEAEVRRLVQALTGRFPGASLLISTVPRWFSRRTLAGMDRTPRYRLPPMPWGLDRPEMGPTFRAWSPRVSEVRPLPIAFFYGLAGLLLPLASRLPILRNRLTMAVLVETRA